MAYQIVITGRIPSKKNSRIPIVIKGRSVSIPSNKYRTWHRDAAKQLIGAPKMTQKGITIKFWLPDNRKTDLNNKAASVLDLLKDVGIIEDDAWQILGQEHYIPMGIDKLSPRAEIEYS